MIDFDLFRIKKVHFMFVLIDLSSIHVTGYYQFALKLISLISLLIIGFFNFPLIGGFLYFQSGSEDISGPLDPVTMETTESRRKQSGATVWQSLKRAGGEVTMIFV